MASSTELGHGFHNREGKKSPSPWVQVRSSPGKSKPPPAFPRLSAGRTVATGSIFHAAGIETASPEQRGGRIRAGRPPSSIGANRRFRCKMKDFIGTTASAPQTVGDKYSRSYFFHDRSKPTRKYVRDSVSCVKLEFIIKPKLFPAK